jgi:hypothetical protein
MNNNGVVRRLAAIPVPAILFILALGLVVFGGYLVSPFYVSTPVIILGLGSRVFEIAVGLAFLAVGLMRIIGTIQKNKKWMLAAPFGMMLSYLFLAILRIVTVGFIPLVWIPMLLCALIAGICRLALLYGPEEAKES